MLRGTHADDGEADPEAVCVRDFVQWILRHDGDKSDASDKSDESDAEAAAAKTKKEKETAVCLDTDAPETKTDPTILTAPTMEQMKHGKAFQQFDALQERHFALLEQHRDRLVWPPKDDKDRYNDILPFKDTRVRLSVKRGDTDPFADYINASHVMPMMPPKFTPYPVRYIAAQAPLPTTFDAWWQMIYENQVPLIVMLTRLRERGGIQKAHQYWPDEASKKGTKYGRVRVHAFPDKTRQHGKSLTLRFFRVSSVHDKKADVLHVTMIQFESWPDYGVPDDFDGFTQLMEVYRQHRIVVEADKESKVDGGVGDDDDDDDDDDEEEEDSGKKRDYARAQSVAACTTPPVVVHCSAGIGRTGTFMTCDMILDELARVARKRRRKIRKKMKKLKKIIASTLPVPALVLDNVPVSIGRCVHAIRGCRPYSVQTVEQFLFCWRFIHHVVYHRPDLVN